MEQETTTQHGVGETRKSLMLFENYQKGGGIGWDKGLVKVRGWAKCITGLGII